MKRALVLSGGGAKGAFQWGALERLAEIGWTEWHVVAGVSVGALNGAMVALGRLADLGRIWEEIDEEMVHRRYPWWRAALRLLRGELGVYDHTPLVRLVEETIGPDPLYLTEFLAGVVDLRSGEYIAKRFPSARFVAASATMPLIWPPVTIGDKIYVDGGVRAVSPLADVLRYEPDEIVIVNCSPRGPLAPQWNFRRIDDVARRVLDILVTDNWVGDVERLLEINGYVEQAARAGLTLTSPEGKPRKYYRAIVIEPEFTLGDSLDFSVSRLEMRRVAGYERAKEVVG